MIYYCQKKNQKKTNNYPHNITQNIKDWPTRNPQIPELNSGDPGRVNSISSTSLATLVNNLVISHDWGKEDGIVTARNGEFPWSSM